MAHLQRETALRQERGKALVRTLHRHELEEAGRMRRQAEQEADHQLARIAALLPGALAAGLSLAEISRVTGVSRPTLYDLRKTETSLGRDLAFEALSTLASTGPLVSTRLAELVELDQRRLKGVLDRLTRDGWAERVRSGGRDAGVMAITPLGEEALEKWEFRAPGDSELSGPLKLALRGFGYSEEELDEIEQKVTVAVASGKSRLGLLRAVRMGVAKGIDDALRNTASPSRGRSGPSQ